MNSTRTALKIHLVLFLLGTCLVLAPPATAQDQTLTGWFSMTIADYPPESGRASEITYGLTDDHGQYHELLLDIELMKPLGGPVALNRRRVTVAGVWEQMMPDTTAKFRVSSIALAASPEKPSALEASPDGTAELHTTFQAAVTGSQAWVTILCRFADSTDVTPYPVRHYERLMGASYPGLDHYWKEVSYGKINLTGSVVVGWYNLPQPRSYYTNILEGGEEDYDAEKIAEDCTAVADVDVFFPDFDGINLVFNHDFGPARGGGPERLTLDGQAQFYGTTWLPVWAQEEQDTWAHEMGHAFGLPHSSGPYGQDDPSDAPSLDTTYDSEWDVMSGGKSLFPYPGYGPLGVHTIAYHKDVLGWIPASRKYVPTRNGTRTITLKRLAQPGSEGYLLAQIPIGDSATDFYTVETRRFAGYDDEIPDEAVVIHKVDTTRADRLAQVVDMDNNGDPNDAGAMWTPGETFTDRANGIQVSIDAAYATGSRVTINTDPTTFRTCIASLSSSSHIFGPERARASVRVVAVEGCDWAARSHSSWLRITAGGSGVGAGTVAYSVALNPSPAARTGTLTINGWPFTVIQAGTNDRLFADNMENGVNGWGNGPPWALTTTVSHSGIHAWTDSPGGNYQNEQNVSLWSPMINLTEVPSATLTFWHRYAFAAGDWSRVGVARQEEGGVGQVVKMLGKFIGTQTTWQQTSFDLSPFVGERIQLVFELISDASGTADGWYIDDVAVFSSDFVPQATLENPQPHSFQSGIRVISGWACEAETIFIELNGSPQPAAYGTPRTDTQDACGDTNNGFGLLVNWNELGAGTHTVRALLDGVEFANTTVRVTTLAPGEEGKFLRGVSGTVTIPDFPHAGDATTLRWEQALQNFVITDGQPNTGGGKDRVAGVQAILGNPSLGSAQSGTGVISGWACEAEAIVIELNGSPQQAGYGTRRTDTRDECGDTNNGFGLLVNWNELGAGTHTVRALLDGQEFASTTVRVTTLAPGEEGKFLRGVRGTVTIPDFPHAGDATTLRWEQALQNFVITP